MTGPIYTLDNYGRPIFNSSRVTFQRVSAGKWHYRLLVDDEVVAVIEQRRVRLAGHRMATRWFQRPGGTAHTTRGKAAVEAIDEAGLSARYPFNPTIEQVESFDTFRLVTENDEWWRTKDGQLLRVEDMEASHRSNLRALLDRTWADQCIVAADRLEAGAMTMQGEMAILSLESEADRVYDLADQLHEQPLYVRLVAMEEAETAAVAAAPPPPGAHIQTADDRGLPW